MVEMVTGGAVMALAVGAGWIALLRRTVVRRATPASTPGSGDPE